MSKMAMEQEEIIDYLGNNSEITTAKLAHDHFAGVDEQGNRARALSERLGFPCPGSAFRA
jgi:hypothetical protein